MTLDKHYKGVTDALEAAAPVRKSAAATLTLNERNTIWETTDTFTVVLPPVAEAAGMAFVMENEKGATITITDGGDAGTAISNTAFQTIKDIIIFFSTGRYWVVIFST